MEAYRCDFCGELFTTPTEIDVRGQIDNEIFRSVMTRTDNGKRVDVCNGCRMVIKRALEARIQKVEEEWDKEWQEGEERLKAVLGIE